MPGNSRLKLELPEQGEENGNESEKESGMITGADVRGSRLRQSTIDEIRRLKVFP